MALPYVSLNVNVAADGTLGATVAGVSESVVCAPLAAAGVIENDALLLLSPPALAES
jgi:hypothetical protein